MFARRRRIVDDYYIVLCASDGDFVIMINNEAAQTFTLGDAGSSMESAGGTLAQYDSAMFIYDAS